VNRTMARWALAALAPVILVSAVTLTSGAASAKAVVPTITCKDLTATITWTPPLVPGTATEKTTQITFSNLSVSGCTTSPASTVSAATSLTATATLTKHGNSCESLSPSAPSSGPPTKYTFVINWNNGGGTSTVKFSGSKTQASPPEFMLGPGKGSGSYKTKAAAVTAAPNSTSAAALTKCITGTGPDLSTVTVTSGSVSL
jgi:hypothetical protein